jgi:hypothetical protein
MMTLFNGLSAQWTVFLAPVAGSGLYKGLRSSGFKFLNPATLNPNTLIPSG